MQSEEIREEIRSNKNEEQNFTLILTPIKEKKFSHKIRGEALRKLPVEVSVSREQLACGLGAGRTLKGSNSCVAKKIKAKYLDLWRGVRGRSVKKVACGKF